jgi:hypothetical protein
VGSGRLEAKGAAAGGGCHALGAEGEREEELGDFGGESFLSDGSGSEEEEEEEEEVGGGGAGREGGGVLCRVWTWSEHQVSIR